jgi:hypothetical protein
MLYTGYHVGSTEVLLRAMLTSGHVSVVCPAMFVYIVPYTWRETLCFPVHTWSVSGGRRQWQRMADGKVGRTIQSLQYPTEDPTTGTIGQLQVSKSRWLAAGTGPQVATYIGLEG